MPQVYATPLKPASGGFGEWEWIEAVEVEGCATYADYEAMLDDPYGAGLQGRWKVTQALCGHVHNERGRIYWLETAPDEIGYEMAWIDEEEL